MSERVKRAERELRRAQSTEAIKQLFSEIPQQPEGPSWYRSFESVTTPNLIIQLKEYSDGFFGIIFIKNKDSANLDNPQLSETYVFDKKGSLDRFVAERRRQTLTGFFYDQQDGGWRTEDWAHNGRDFRCTFYFDGYDIVSFVKTEWEAKKAAQENSPREEQAT